MQFLLVITLEMISFPLYSSESNWKLILLLWHDKCNILNPLTHFLPSVLLLAII